MPSTLLTLYRSPTFLQLLTLHRMMDLPDIIVLLLEKLGVAAEVH